MPHGSDVLQIRTVRETSRPEFLAGFPVLSLFF